MFATDGPACVARWPLVRVVPGQTTVVELLSAEWIRLVTHYHRATTLCLETEKCPLCFYLPARVYWYLPVHLQASGTMGLLECSNTACSTLETRLRFLDLKLEAGLILECSRQGKKSPVRLEPVGPSGRLRSAPLELWGSALFAVYRLPPIAPRERLEDYGDRVADRVAARAEVIVASVKAGKKQ